MVVTLLASCQERGEDEKPSKFKDTFPGNSQNSQSNNGEKCLSNKVIDISEDGNYLFSILNKKADRKLLKWNLKTSKLSSSIKFPTMYSGISDDGKFIIKKGIGKYFNVYEIKSKKLMLFKTIKIVSFDKPEFHFSPDNTKLVIKTSFRPGRYKLEVYDLSSMERLFRKISTQFLSIRMNKSSDKIYLIKQRISDRMNPYVYIYDIHSGRQLDKIKIKTKRYITNFYILDTKVIVELDQYIRIYDLETHELLHEVFASSIWDVDEESEFALISKEYGNFSLLDLKTYKLQYKFKRKGLLLSSCELTNKSRSAVCRDESRPHRFNLFNLDEGININTCF